MVKRGEGWLVTRDPIVGSEILKTRPCVVVSPNELNGILRRTIVAPITSGSHPAPSRVPVTFLRRSEPVLLDQIRTVDRARLLKRLGVLEQGTVTAALAVLAGMFEE